MRAAASRPLLFRFGRFAPLSHFVTASALPACFPHWGKWRAARDDSGAFPLRGRWHDEVVTDEVDGIYPSSVCSADSFSRGRSRFYSLCPAVGEGLAPPALWALPYWRIKSLPLTREAYYIGTRSKVLRRGYPFTPPALRPYSPRYAVSSRCRDRTAWRQTPPSP